MSSSVSRTNLTFFGDIIGDVSIAPLSCGYQVTNHPSSMDCLTSSKLPIGPIIFPDVGAEGSFERVAGGDRRLLRGVDAWHEFVKLEPNTNNFVEFAKKYGLLGSSPGVVVVVNGNLVECDPLVDWFHHYCKLRLLSLVFGKRRSEEHLLDQIRTTQAELQPKVLQRFSTVAISYYENPPFWMSKTGPSGAHVGKMFQPSFWHFSDTTSQKQLVREAFNELSYEISKYTRIAVRHRGRKGDLNLGDSANANRLVDGFDGFVITTTLEPTSLIGAMYVGVLLEASSYRIRRNLRQCQHCRANILSDHKLRKYCSNACRQKAKRARKEGAEQNG